MEFANITSFQRGLLRNNREFNKSFSILTTFFIYIFFVYIAPSSGKNINLSKKCFLIQVKHHLVWYQTGSWQRRRKRGNNCNNVMYYPGEKKGPFRCICKYWVIEFPWGFQKWSQSKRLTFHQRVRTAISSNCFETTNVF